MTSGAISAPPAVEPEGTKEEIREVRKVGGSTKAQVVPYAVDLGTRLWEAKPGGLLGKSL